MENKYLVYDKIVEATYLNLVSLARRNNNIIVLKGFEQKDTKNKKWLFCYKVALIAKSINNCEIQANIPFWIKIFKKEYRHINKISKDKIYNINDILNYTCTGFNQKIDIINEIYDEYYGK